MAPHSPPAPGNPAGGPPAPPLDPRALDTLLRHHPARAARVLASMRPAARHAQLLAHAALTDAPPTRIQAEWADLLRLAHPGEPDDPPPAAPIEPERLALIELEEARAAIAALTPPQRVTQAVAQAAWLASFGYPVGFEEILAVWEAEQADEGRAA
jgi:hypothetical protein